ncbi:MAG: TolC family protein [Myxococcales bacterium]|nr:TolC family protein [Myxococcales bacterium]
MPSPYFGTVSVVGSVIGLALLTGLPDAVAQDRAALTLNAAWQQTASRHPALHAASAAVQLARSAADIAAVPLLPATLLSVGYQQTTANWVPRPGVLPKNLAAKSGQSSLDTYAFWQSSVDARWLVTDFGRTRSAVTAADFAADQHVASGKALRRQLWLQVALAYCGVVAAEQDTLVANELRELAVKRQQAVHARVQARIRPAAELARADSDLAMAQLAVADGEQEIAAARQQLTVAMAAPQPVVAELTAVTSTTDVPAYAQLAQPDALQQWTEVASRHREEWAALQAQKSAVQAQLIANERAQLPSIFVGASASLQGTEIDGLVANAAIGGGIEWPAAALWQARPAATALQAQLRAIVAQQDVLRAQVRGDLDAARVALLQASRRAPVLAAALQAAQAAYDQAQARYAAGATVLVEVLDAAQGLAAVRRDAVATELRRAQAAVRWQAAIGAAPID